MSNTQQTLEQLQAAFKKDDSQSSRPNNYYPFWLMEDGEQAIVRFLPDADNNNPLGFMVEKVMHALHVNGDEKAKSIPCVSMYGEKCPICATSAAFYKEEDKVNGKKYWKKKQHLVQAIVVKDPISPKADEESHEGKVRFLALGYQLYNIIKEAFESGELDDIPYAYKGGCDFIIKKTKQGEYATYAVGSKFARKSSDLSDDEIAAVSDQLVELSSLLPKAPAMEKVEALLEAALTGSAYDDSTGSSSGSEPLKLNKKAESTDDADSKAEKLISEMANTPEESTKTPVEDSGEFADEAAALLAKIRSRKST